MDSTTALAEVFPSALKGDDARKGRAGAPDATTEARELDDLRMVNEQVRAGALVLNVVCEDVRFGRLEPVTQASIENPQQSIGRV